MTSNINFSGIDALYPVAGQDNDTQGFRDNFSYIRDSLQSAKSEIEDLQLKAVLKDQLTDGGAVDNDLGGGTIYNGSFHDFHGESFLDTIEATPTDTINIDVTAGNAQVFTIKRDVDFTFRNWPGTSSVGKFATVRIHLLTGNAAAHNATFYSENGGAFFCEPNVTTYTPNPAQPSVVHPRITVSDTGKHQVIEVWSVTNGSKLYVRYLGEF